MSLLLQDYTPHPYVKIKDVPAGDTTMEISVGDMGLWFQIEDCESQVSMKVSQVDCLTLGKILLHYGLTGEFKEQK